MEKVEEMELDHLDGLDAPEGAGQLSLPEVFDCREETGQGQETELEAGQAVATNPIIVTKIFQHLDSIDLWALAPTNKLWKELATSLMEKRNDFNIDIVAHRKCSSKVVICAGKLIMDIVRPNGIAPVNGIGLDINPDGPACPSPVVTIPNLEEILAMLSLESLQLCLSSNWLDHQNCPQFKLAKGLLEYSNGSLTDLKLKITSGRDEFVQLAQQFSFPNLKILRLEEDDDDETGDEAYINYIRALVSLAPNLKQLDLRGNVNLQENFLGERLPEVLFYEHLIEACFISESFLGSLRLNNLTWIPCSELDAEDFQRFMRSLPVLLGTCCTTLTELLVDPIIGLSFISQGVILENVEELYLWINYEILQDLEPRILNNFKKLDFKRIFPKMSTVVVDSMYPGFHPLRDNVEQLIEAVANLDQRPDGAADSISTLQLAGGLSHQTVGFLAELFPCIEKLVVGYADGKAPISFGSIWKQNWTNLKTLRISVEMATFAQENLDSVFCGIFPEEVAELREQTDDYLKSVNIVPVKPSFMRLKNLSSLSLTYSDDVDVVGPATVLSKVTGLIAFARRDTLRVTLTTKRPEFYQALKHMKPFATVFLEKET